MYTGVSFSSTSTTWAPLLPLFAQLGLSRRSMHSTLLSARAEHRSAASARVAARVRSAGGGRQQHVAFLRQGLQGLQASGSDRPRSAAVERKEVTGVSGKRREAHWIEKEERKELFFLYCIGLEMKFGKKQREGREKKHIGYFPNQKLIPRCFRLSSGLDEAGGGPVTGSWT